MPIPGWPKRAPRLRPRGPGVAPARPEMIRLEARVLPAVFTVNSFTDGVDAHPGDGVAQTSDGRTTLRAAIMEANALGVASTIVLPAGSYTLSLPGPNEDAAATGDLDILAPITVQGAGSGTTTVHSDGFDRLFDVRTAGSVAITGVALTGGRADIGGAVRTSRAFLDLDDVTLSDNQATGDGGAIAASGATGRITLSNDLFRNNSAGGSGGAILMDGMTLIANGVTFAQNSAAGDGGALAVVDTANTRLGGAQVKVSTFSGNTAGNFGGAILAGPLTLVRLTDSTVTLNQATVGGGGYRAGGTLGFGNTIVAGNTATQANPDVFGPVSSQGFNLIGDGTGASGFVATDLVGTAAAPINPLLSPLILHGGPTPVHVPVPGSPALGHGQAFDVADQRGVARPSSGATIGAVEAHNFAITSTSGGQHTAAGTAFGPLRATVTEGGLVLPGAVVTFTAPAAGPSGFFAESPVVRADDTGVATAPTFTANGTPGAYSVRAAAAANLFTDIALTNDVAPVGSFALAAAPPFQAGVPFQLTVTALNPDGSRNFNYAGTISFTTDAVQSVLPGPYTFNSEDRGQRTFTVTLGSFGPHFIRVADPAGPVGQINVNLAPSTNRFDVTAPQTVNEGEPFSVTVTVRDAAGNILSNYVGPVTFTSDDPRAILPTNAFFTAADEGVKQFDGLSLRPPGPRTITVSVADGTVGSVSVGVVNFGPTGLGLTTDHAAINEGDSLTVTGTFTNPDPMDTHTVTIKWGDGTNTVKQLGPGVLTFRVSHPYADDPAGPNDVYPIGVTVTDAAGGATTGSAKVTVTNVPPTLPASGGLAVGDAGTPLGQVISFTDPGADGWTVTADFGDKTGPQNVPVGPGRSFTLNHAYTAEGTYHVTITLQDDDGGSDTLIERVVVFLPGTTGVQILAVPAGTTGTLPISGGSVTLSNLGGTATAFLLVGLVPVRSLDGLTGSPTTDPTLLTSAYDIRVLDAGLDSVVTATLSYPAGAPGADPSLQYYDPATGQFLAVQASGGGLSVDKGTRVVTFSLGSTSAPTVANLGGTVFTLSVPAPTPAPAQTASTGGGTTPFFLASAASAALASVDGAVPGPIPTTGLSSSSALTVAVSAAEGLRRNGGDETPAGRLVNTHTLSTVIQAAIEIRDFVVEALRMWIDQPAPIAAPIITPADGPDQVRVHETALDVAAAAKAAAAAPADPVAYEAVVLPPAAVTADPVIASAETHPWWLDAYKHRSAAEPSGTAPIPIPPAREPDTADRAAAALTAVWLGGTALVVSAPDALEDDEEEWPRRREAEDETDI